MLEIKNLKVSYGAIQALKGVSLKVEEGEMVTLIGPNGAGKTTLLHTLSGILRPTAGTIHYQKSGQKMILHRLAPHRIVQEGIAQVPEGRLIFQNLSVLENLELGAYARGRKASTREEMEQVFFLFPRLKERIFQNAGTLSGGEQQMLAVGRALMAKPRLLLLDEPSLGLAPTLVQQIFKALVSVNRQGTSILLVEQDAYLALETAHRGYVLETGEIRMEGPCDKLLNDPEVRKAYLGG